MKKISRTIKNIQIFRSNKKPELPLDGIWSKCQTCQIVVDQENSTIGIGDQGCFDGDAKYEKLCDGPNDRCVVDMEVDWFPKGFHTYRVKRGCSSLPVRMTISLKINSHVLNKYCIYKIKNI